MAKGDNAGSVHPRFQRIPNPIAPRPEGTDFDEAIVVFFDNTAVAVISKYDGPFSDVTPDITVCDPEWRIFK